MAEVAPLTIPVEVARLVSGQFLATGIVCRDGAPLLRPGNPVLNDTSYRADAKGASAEDAVTALRAIAPAIFCCARGGIV